MMSPPPPRGAPPPREDSSIEPPAFRASFWLPSPHTSPPVQLVPGLSPSLRSALPQPKALRPSSQPHPTQSDLSIASTRAELEPTALRDLRRVTVPLSLMDPWAYQHHEASPRAAVPPSPAVPAHRPRFVKSASATALVTERLSDVRAARKERWSVMTDARGERDAKRAGPAKRLAVRWLARRRRGARKRDAWDAPAEDGDEDEDEDDMDRFGEYDAGAAPAGFKLYRPRAYPRFERLGARGSADTRRMAVPDRFHDEIPLMTAPRRARGAEQRETGYARAKVSGDSVMSALTRESEERQRPRAMSESGAVSRRASAVARRERARGVWDKIFRRKSGKQSRRSDSGVRRSGKLG